MTEDVWRNDTAKQHAQYPYRSLAQIVCHLTLQITFSVLMMCLLGGLSGCSDYPSGEAAYEQGDYATALKKLRPFAEKGNPKAQFRLGWMYSRGEGVIQNDEEAVEWYRKAAQQDHVAAQFNLGARYVTGEGVVPDSEEAMKWYERAIEQGPGGDQALLGLRYVNGAGVAQDYGKAVKCFQIAVEQGHTIAPVFLAAIYASGMGVDRDYVTAYMWYHRAGILGIEKAHEERDKILKEMTIVEITEARRLAREWKPTSEN